ncbi:MAG TPA: sodium:solute symporter [Muricauda sp.]|uniref:Sodium:solute symporter n=1 Tax=Flagellimonas aurea TaxID=2915619 RepID=A0ABS3G2D4_9FLAO|nr:sodium:solute symporter [Allomuricauda aurea]MAO15689.1 sodium:solute symporter [Allomuricauda sp.]MBO0353252.1 sodium:solute symporter [Allomuricauda aurea]UBZ13642.1 sodium:solute symporter [Allomuricauda aquimarina]HBU79208.1 sodium:solute symporter [Allomuricauda sp.]|tara:strand:- start:308 stop:2014 length:1707 start_codon:yes stop_codon:yes gene_type:complete
MALLDWIILGSTLIFIVAYGVWKTRGNNSVDDYVRGGDDVKWWTIGLSVMATQASAITFLSTPGQAFHDGMGFVQFYFGLPLAMIVICLVFIPIYKKLKVFTAYEMLEGRFDLKTRTLTALLFLVQRGLAAGITIFAPSIILSAVLGWDLRTLNIIIGISVIIYTVSGGTKAVSVTQKQQMFIIMLGMFFAFFFILGALPTDISFDKALKIAGANNKLNILDFSFDTNNRYTFWSGITGGFFLALAYFGTDQSQVQRYLSGRSVKESQWALIFNGIFKIPMQFFILLVGAMVFVFYQYNSSPLNFNPAATEAIMQSDYANDYQALENDHKELEKEKRMAQHSFSAALELKEYNAIEQAKQDIIKINEKETANRETAKDLIAKADATVETNDKDYVFIHFILNNLPMGLIGLLLAVILSAAMSSTASELNALGTITALDLYKRNVKKEHGQEHYLKATKAFTLLWGIIAIIIANVASLFDNLIQLVNIIGSIFYGNVLGIFLLAFFFKFVKGNAVFVAAIVTQIIVIIGWYLDWMSYLWLNAFGCVLVILLAIITQLFDNFLGNSPIEQ